MLGKGLIVKYQLNNTTAWLDLQEFLTQLIFIINAFLFYSGMQDYMSQVFM